ncbi:hypothetical protein [Paraflavitalea sp. CAU 1676]|uniref:hypothetical protein n=1 Tax=Paraflavitalea sp. CAU 1676 TaxID=3032598 RepID=UPI0023DA31C1|nr:hypothetical protein [Paraflavitalea sp. CAU 1676]MDF2190493.1 hypothetical protein [Paraflavitalea sp. CAU 1676]
MKKEISLKELHGELAIYFNWSANALVPIFPGASDLYLKNNFETIHKVGQSLMRSINYLPGTIYRGIILKDPVATINPHKKLMHLSFSTEKSVAIHFADTNGFGAGIMDVATRLGTYGYVIEYWPKISEILFHYDFMSILPYAESFSLLGMDGILEVNSLMRQREIIILQPSNPFTNILPVRNI